MISVAPRCLLRTDCAKIKTFGVNCEEGFHLLLSVNPQGLITGYGVAPASTKDPDGIGAEDCFALRQFPHPSMPTVGAPGGGYLCGGQGVRG